MASSDPTAHLPTATGLEHPFFDPVIRFLMAFPDPNMPLSTLIPAMLIAVAVISTLHFRTVRHARPLRILRVLFSPRYVFHRSHTLDVLYFIVNTKIAGLTFGWLIVSAFLVTNVSHDALTAVFGLPAPTALPAWAIVGIGSVTLYIAYEFAYWVDHYLAHRLPILWEFHKVHHQAEVLSPLTVFRVHPIDSVVFYNILSLVLGLVNGALYWAFGMEVGNATAFSHAAILTFAGYFFIHLQHSHVWIAFTGFWGRVLISPAHHQIHHSQNPAHFDKNMGSCLAVFDWLFGTLYIPSKEREKLVFGVAPQVAEPHTLTEGLVMPFLRGFNHIRGWMGLPPIIVGQPEPQAEPGLAPASQSPPA